MINVFVFLISFFSFTGVFALILAMIFQSLTVGASGLALALGLGSALVVVWKNPIKIESKYDQFDVVMLLAFGLFCYRQFFWLYFIKDGGIHTLDSHNFGDLPFHLTFISNFVRGEKFWPDNPIFVGEKIHYHFGVDLLTAALIKVGISTGSALALLGFTCGLLMAFALWLWGKGFAVGAFLFSGGLSGYAVLLNGEFKDYQGPLAWKNLALTLLVPQRGYLLGFPIGLFLLWAWRRLFFQNEKVVSYFLMGILWGILPFFQLHSFLFVSLIFGVWTLFTRKFKEGLHIFKWAFVPAVIFFLMLTNNFQKASMMSFKAWWMIGTQNKLSFFLLNYGFFFIFFLATLFFSLKEKKKNDLLILLPAFTIYALLLFVCISPWDWDNTKVMVWCYLLVLPVVDSFIVEKMNANFRLASYVALFFSGFVCIWAAYNITNTGHRIADTAEVDSLCEAIEPLDRSQRFAAVQTYNHPLSLCGAKVVAGYSAHLWSHGIKAGPFEEELKKLMLGAEGWEASAQKLKARYIFWGKREQEEFFQSTKSWETKSKKVASGKWGSIFDLGNL